MKYQANVVLRNKGLMALISTCLIKVTWFSLSGTH